MRLMGEQFVTGETIAEALPMPASWKRKVSVTLTICWASRADRRRCTGVYGFLSAGDSAIGKASNGRGIYEGPGISINCQRCIRATAAPSMTG